MDATSTDHVRTTLIDVLGYVGVALALAGIAIALADASLGAQTAAGMVATVALLAAGWLVGGAGAADAHRRMRGIFWFVALQTWSQVAMVLLGPDGADIQGRMLVLLSALVGAALAVPLWWIERRSLQLIGAYITVLTVALALFYAEDQVFGQAIPHVTWSAVVATVLGAATVWFGARAVLMPRRTAMVLGSLTFILGAMFATLDIVETAMSGGELSDLPAIAVLVTSVLVLFMGERTEVVAVFGIGVVGTIGAVLSLVAQHATSESDGLIVLIVGLLLIGATIAVLKGGRSGAAPPPMPVPPPEAPEA